VNWAALGAIASIIGVATSLLVAAYVYGKLSQQVKDGRDRTDDHSDLLKVHGEKLESHGNKIGRLEEWKSGFNAAARVAGSKEAQ